MTVEGTCRRCGSRVFLMKTGKTERSYKWVSDREQPKDSWKCGNDPAFPVRGHAPVGAP